MAEVRQDVDPATQALETARRCGCTGPGTDKYMASLLVPDPQLGAGGARPASEWLRYLVQALRCQSVVGP